MAWLTTRDQSKPHVKGPPSGPTDQRGGCAINIQKLPADFRVVDQRPYARNVCRHVTAIQITPVDETHKRAVSDQNVERMQVAMEPGAFLSCRGAARFLPEGPQARPVDPGQILEANEPLLHRFSPGPERNAPKGVGGGILRGGLMQRREGAREKHGVSHPEPVALRGVSLNPLHHAPGPSEQLARLASMHGDRDFEWQARRENRQPALLVHEQSRGGPAPGKAGRMRLTEKKGVVVPALADQMDRLLHEIRAFRRQETAYRGDVEVNLSRRVVQEPRSPLLMPLR